MKMILGENTVVLRTQATFVAEAGNCEDHKAENCGNKKGLLHSGKLHFTPVSATEFLEKITLLLHSLDVVDW